MATATATSTRREQDACLLKESAQLHLPPVSMRTLKSMDFFRPGCEARLVTSSLEDICSVDTQS